ncbi:hypothetical protein ACFL3V_07050 [Nanoarchaeota archaeon]
MMMKGSHKDLWKRISPGRAILIVSFSFLVVIASAMLVASLSGPSGTITIVGPNGTEVTGTRNVLLNLTFAYALGNITGCRWANDVERGLYWAHWENCTPVKEWILSEGYGNKTVYYQIRGNQSYYGMYTDTILYSYIQDYTPPSQPIVYDGLAGDDIDWWNSATTLHAHWFNATEDISGIYYRYRILENSSCYNNDCNFTSIGRNTSVTVTGLTLGENWTYYFDVQAYNIYNISAGPARSDGTRIDITPPEAPALNSTTHPDQARTYQDTLAVFNWTASDILSNSNMSGIEGYSHILDTHPGTVPDDIIEERSWESLKSMPSGVDTGQVLRANSTTLSPHTHAVFSQLHANLTENESIRVNVRLAELTQDIDDLMGMKVFLMKYGSGDVITFNQDANAISNIVNMSQDIKYAESMSLATTYQFDLTVNESVTDDVSNNIYIVVSGLPEDNDNRNNLSLAASSAIDTSTWKFVCNNSDSCASTTASYNPAVEVKRYKTGDTWTKTYNNLADGTYYFHVKAKDRAGNWGNVTHYRIAVSTGGVSVGIISPESGTIYESGNDYFNISVTVMVSGNASVRTYVNQPGGGTYASQENIFSTKHNFHDVTLKTGTNEIYAIANNSEGITSLSTGVYVILARDLVPVTDKTLRVTYTGGTGCSASANARVCSGTSGGASIGIANENSGSAQANLVQADTTVNTIKIFMTRAVGAGEVTDIADEFEHNNFLDGKSPAFGYRKKPADYIMRNELRYADIWIGGGLRLPSGKYVIYLNHNGVTADGKVNLSMSIQ